MTFTDNEIALSRHLHELGVRPEIWEGDRFFIQHPEEPSKPIFHVCKDMEDAREINGYRSDVILLWSWERCREWLREKGYFLAVVNDCNPGKVYFEFAEDKFIKTGKSFGKWGQADAEAAMAAMVQIA